VLLVLLLVVLQRCIWSCCWQCSRSAARDVCPGTGTVKGLHSRKSVSRVFSAPLDTWIRTPTSLLRCGPKIRVSTVPGMQLMLTVSRVPRLTNLIRTPSANLRLSFWIRSEPTISSIWFNISTTNTNKTQPITWDKTNHLKQTSTPTVT